MFDVASDLGVIGCNEAGEFQFEEMLRYRIECTGDWANIRIFEPAFFDDSVP